ncbi:MAG: endonuclease MutS2 [Methanobacterium sp.]|uniref:helix-hairpin-helix domain-containing protein n=1 Tax=Methanobacterium sp. TaxID=2164 RepID=UPI003D64EF43|nr:endonuclease MutS2 [Methanobacterium sp.]
MDLTKIRGIGEKLAKKIVDSFGSHEALESAIGNFEVDKLSRIEGVSQSKAIEIINAALGNPKEEFLKTGRTIQIYNDVIARILSYAHTKYGKNRILLISPTKDVSKIQENLDFVMNSKKAISNLPIDEIKNLLKKVNPSWENKPKYDPTRALLVESREDYNQLLDMDLNKYCTIMTTEELESLEDYEFVVYIYSTGQIEIDDTYNVAMVTSDSTEYEIVPETVLSYFYTNYDLLGNILKIKDILGRESVIPEVLEILDSLESAKVDESMFNDAVEDAKTHADLKLKESIKKVDLKGDEVLALMNEGMPAKIQKIFDGVIKEAINEIKDKTGCVFDPFIPKYPIEIDYHEFERVKRQEISKQHLKAFDKKVIAASRLSSLKEMTESEIHEILEFDYEFALGCFAYYYDLNPPQIGDEFNFKEGIHLNLALENNFNIQKIDYSLKTPENVALLTGANSGGKTTLLETLAQISVMTQMGLPVCASEATVKLVDEVYFFSKKRSLDAGAFESFLNTFMPVVTTDTHKLVLLDELEAITELEAAVKIIASFIDLLKDSDSYAVIVTHMARELMKFTQVRVDGIEAKGLDDDYNLLVDRTPKMNYLAKSTPELILRMIYEKSDGKLKEIYGQMLEKF